MKLSRIIVGVLVCALSSQLCWSQERCPANPRRALGYFDYSTGAFQPMGQTDDVDAYAAAAASATTGTLVVNFTITIKSAIATTSPIVCDVTASITEVSATGLNFISEDASVAATRTGNTAKCTVTIPYSWVLLNSTTAKVGLNYNLAAVKTTAGSTGLLSRSSTGGLATLAIPANGATTTQTVNAVL